MIQLIGVLDNSVYTGFEDHDFLLGCLFICFSFNDPPLCHIICCLQIYRNSIINLDLYVLRCYSVKDIQLTTILEIIEKSHDAERANKFKSLDRKKLSYKMWKEQNNFYIRQGELPFIQELHI
jgi:hypothetical protein